MSLLKQSSTAQPLVFLMVDSTDHITPKTGLSPTVTLSKAGGSFASPAGAVTEIGNGWYKVAGNATDTATLGPLILHATGTAADPVDVLYDVVAFDPQDAVRIGLTALPNAAADAAGGLPISDAGGLDLDAKIGALTFGTANRVNAQVYGLEASAITSGAFASGAIHATAMDTGAIRADVFAAGAVDAAALAADAVAKISDGVWDEVLSGHATAGTTGAALSAAGSAGDPWSTSLPGAYGSGTAGNILGNNLNATVSSRSSHSAADVWAVGTRVLTAATNLVLPANALSNVTAWTVNITGSLSGSVGSVAGAVGSANAVETGISISQALSALIAWATGKAENGNTNAIDFYAPDGVTQRIAMAGVDVDGNRTGSTLTL
jgi:hypothetical protein